MDRLPPHLEAFPGLVLLLDTDGGILASNAAARAVTGGAARFDNLLDRSSLDKWRSLIADQTRPCTAELVLETTAPLDVRTFFVPLPAAGTRLLVELPQNADAARLHETLTGLNSELINTQRENVKQKAELQRTLASLREVLDDRERLSTELQAHSEELEAQNEELLAITEELRAQQEKADRLNTVLEEQAEELKRVMHSRERFFSAMSHELRTPLTAVLGYGHLLLDEVAGELNERQREFVERTRAAAQHLNSLLDDILDLAKLESGTLELSLEQTTIAGLMGEIVQTLRPAADAAGSEVRLRLEHAPTSVTTDVRALRQILLNLLGNALKFGGGHPVTVSCTRRGESYIIEVADEGVGVPPEDAERIFEEFGQGEAGRHVKGTGLGLSIARQLAERLGGRLYLADSSPGATFRLELPVAGPSS